MLFSTLTVLAGLSAMANAHFSMSYPAPRGPFDAEAEPNFCDGYATPAAERITFPLTGGYVEFNAEHPQWTMQILASTAASPSSFDDFKSSSGDFQLAIPNVRANGEGNFCIPVDFTKSPTAGLVDGANVTIQLHFVGGDGSLYQCADLTLSSSATAPTNATCTNVEVPAFASTSEDSSAAVPSATSTPASGAMQTVSKSTGLAVSVLSLVGFALAL